MALQKSRGAVDHVQHLPLPLFFLELTQLVSESDDTPQRVEHLMRHRCREDLQLLMRLLDLLVHLLLCDVPYREELAKFVLVVHVVTVDAHNLFLPLHKPRLLLHINLEHTSLVQSLFSTEMEDLHERDHALRVLCPCGLPQRLADRLGEKLFHVQRLVVCVLLESHALLRDGLFHLFELLISELYDFVLAVDLALHKHGRLQHFVRALLHDAFLLRWLQGWGVAKNFCHRGVAELDLDSFVIRENLLLFLMGQDDTLRLVVEDGYELLLLLPYVLVFEQELSLLHHQEELGEKNGDSYHDEAIQYIERQSNFVLRLIERWQHAVQHQSVDEDIDGEQDKHAVFRRILYEAEQDKHECGILVANDLASPPRVGHIVPCLVQVVSVERA